MAKQINRSTELPEAPETPVEADGEAAVGTNNDERIALMNRINDQVDAGRADELANVNDDDTTEPFTIEAQNAAQQAEEAIEATPEEAVIPEPEAVAPPKFKIRVNGKDLELTQDELIARAQKVEAADAYLAEAVRLRREQQDLIQQQQKPSVPDVSAEEEERALVRAIQMGTEDEAMAAIRKLKSGPSVTADDIARTIDERLTFKEAAARFQTEYKDVMGDPVLRKMVLQRDQELLTAGDRRDYWERYQEVGNEVRTWRDGLIKANTPAAAPTNPQEAKQLRKAAAPTVPVAASRKAPAAAVEDDKEESMSDIIASIAKARGGPQWART